MSRPKKKPGPRAYRGEGELWDLHDQFLVWMRGTGFAEASVKGAHSDLSWFLRFLGGHGWKGIQRIDLKRLQLYAMSLRQEKNGIKPSMRHVVRRLTTVRNFFQWARIQRVIKTDPAADLEIPRVPSSLPKVVLSLDEVNRLLEACDMRSPVGFRDRVLLELLYATGVRTSELFGVHAEDIDFVQNRLRIRRGKGGKEGLIPVPGYTLGGVKEYIEKIRSRWVRLSKGRDRGVLFLSYTGTPMDKNGIGALFKRARKAAGIERNITPLGIRHSISTHLLEAGMGLRYIQELLRHEKPETTAGYSAVTVGGLRKHFAVHHPREKAQKSP